MNTETLEMVMDGIDDSLKNKLIKDYTTDEMVSLFNAVIELSNKLPEYALVPEHPEDEIEIEYKTDENLVALYMMVKNTLKHNGKPIDGNVTLVGIEKELKARDPEIDWGLE